MKKPLLITYEYPPDYGGVGKYLEQEVASFGNDVVVVRAQDHAMALWPEWLPLMWHTLRLLRTSQCDSIWVSHILPIGYVALVYKKIFKIPYRVYLHGLDLVRPRKSIWKSFWMRTILNNADEIICNSNATAELLSYYNISPSIAHVKYPRIQSINAQKYESIGRELRQKYGISDKPVLLTVSRLIKRKGIDLVIRSLPEVWKQIPDLVYVVVGDGEEASYLRELARNNPKIIFTHSIEDEEKYGWLSACDCFILTPRDDPDDFEGYGIVYKEAQMFSKPVIGSRVHGVPEAIGDDGVLIEPDNIDQIVYAICQALRHQ
ncbi:glycosyltransferase family 4 protein [Patescibacteria group bacterium]|nr:glycosyltransferase family 4 protein [Patescibacteria group bacterium]